MKYDVLIPVSTKDLVTVQFCIDSVKLLNPSPQNIYLVTEDHIKTQISLDCKQFKQSDVINTKPYEVNYRRPNWILQQFIKLLQDVTDNDQYLFIDSDAVFLKSVDLFNEHGKPYFFHNHLIPQDHIPYRTFNKRVFDLDKMVDHTFICDFMMFDKNITKEIVPSEKWLLTECNKVLSESCLIADQEIYGNYVMKTRPKSVEIKKINSIINGVFYPKSWTYLDIERRLDEVKKSGFYDMTTFHRWT